MALNFSSGKPTRPAHEAGSAVSNERLIENRIETLRRGYNRVVQAIPSPEEHASHAAGAAAEQAMKIVEHEAVVDVPVTIAQMPVAGAEDALTAARRAVEDAQREVA